MSLRELAEADLALIIEDGDTGFGWAVTLTDPNENTQDFTALSDDIAQVIDPDTGQAVSGRLASVVFRISTLTAAGFSLPQGIADSAQKPWIVDFNDIGGTPYKFKVAQSNPDRALGVVTCLLELYS